MEIRRAAPKDDPEAIGELYAQSWKSAYRGIVPDEYLDSLSGKRWSSFISSSDFEAYVLLLGGAYAGTASVCPGRDEKKPGWGEIVSIYLLPEHFGKGCGKPLLAAALRALSEKGYKNIYLWVLEKNSRARRFYEKNGFAETADRTETMICGRKLTEIRYVYRG